MPMSDGTVQKRVAKLEREVASLEKTMRTLDGDAPRKDNETGIPPENAGTDKNNSASGKVPFASKVYPSPNDSNKSDKSWYKTFDGWRKRLEALGILFAIGYAVVTYCMWQDQASNFKKAQRPWVNANFQSPALFFYVGQPVVYIFTLRNYGQSPALDTSITTITAERSSVDWPEIQSQMNHTVPDNTASMSFFGGQEIPVAGPGINSSGVHPLTQEEIDRIQDGTYHVIVFGKLEYSDSFTPDRHTTTFCVFYTPYNAEPVKHGGWGGCPVKETAD